MNVIRRRTTRMRPRRVHLMAAAALATALIATACGTSASGGTASGGSGPHTGPLVIALSRQLTGLDPGNSGSLDSDASVQSAIFSSLTTIGPDEQLHGDLATAWQQTSTTQWQFTLRSGVKFSNGDTLDANTIVANFNRLLDPKSTLQQTGPLRQIITSTSAPNPTTLIINTNGPYINLPDRLSATYFVDPAWIATHNPVTQPLGSGPYEATSVDLETGVTLKANPLYYGTKPAFPDVKYEVLASEAARVAAAKSGEVDLADLIDPQDLGQFSSDPDVTTGSISSTWTMTLRFNATKAPLNNLDVRLALNYAVDKATIAKSLLGPNIQPSPGQVLTPGSDSINPNLQAYPYDPAKAKQLLAAGGYPNGFTLNLDVPSGTYLAGTEIAQVIASELQQVGVTVNITQTPFPTWVNKSYTNNVADLIYIGYSSGYPSTVDKLVTYTSSNIQSHFPPDPIYNQLVAKAAQASTPQEQQDLINQATQEFYNNPYALFLFPQPLTYVVKKSIKWTPRPEHWLRPQDITPAG